MKQFNKMDINKSASNIMSVTKTSLILMLLSLSVVSCKKSDDSNLERDYGYAKVIVECTKCSVSYLSAGQLNEFVVEGSEATNYIRYKKDYSLDINIQSLDKDQSLSLGVYSRSGKQIFLKSSAQKASETWNSKIIIP